MADTTLLTLAGIVIAGTGIMFFAQDISNWLDKKSKELEARELEERKLALANDPKHQQLIASLEEIDYIENKLLEAERHLAEVLEIQAIHYHNAENKFTSRQDIEEEKNKWDDENGDIIEMLQARISFFEDKLKEYYEPR